jgi:seryl-tRNA synthetase
VDLTRERGGSMLKRIIENFKDGLSRIRWFATVFSERFKIEMAVIKLMYRSDEMEKKRQELFRTIGERIYEIKGNTEKNVFRDKVIVEAMEDIERMEKDIEELKEKVAEIHSVSV